MRGQDTLRTPTGMLHVVGLRRWTVQMIQDSAARYAPGQDLASHACAAILRFKLGFADAAVTWYDLTRIGGASYGVVTVVEPQDSQWVRYLAPYRDTLPNRPDWAAALSVFDSQNVLFQRAIQRPAFYDWTQPPGDATVLRRFLQRRRRPADLTAALQTLSRDGNAANRAVAVLLLSNFTAADSVWHVLVDHLRDPSAAVSATADQVVSALRVAQPRPIDWRPAVASLRALLDGTNLFAHNTVMELLEATADPALVQPLLRGGGFMVIAKLHSSDPRGRGAAHRLLVRLSGRDYGSDAEGWAAWVRGL
jgi:hypothetical protein